MNNPCTSTRPPPVTLYVAEGSVLNKTQILFPSIHTCEREKDFLAATMYDFTNICFTEGIRNGKNFMSANCLVGDIDNLHCDDPNEWLEPIDIAKRLHGVPVFYQYSRNNQKVKDGKSPRPKFHFVVPVTSTIDPIKYNWLWRLLKAVVPEMDPQTKDLGRFYYGGGLSNTGELFSGTLTLDEFCEINEIAPAAEVIGTSEREISCFSNSSPLINIDDEVPEDLTIYGGERNDKLFKFARKCFSHNINNPIRDSVVWNKLTCLATQHCSPPFPMNELQSVFKSAKFYADRDRLNMLKLFRESVDEKECLDDKT